MDENIDWVKYVNLSISLVAVIVSCIALYKSSESSKLSNSIRMGIAELEVRKMIVDARKVFYDVSDKICEDKSEIRQQRLNVAKEDLANAYDEACMKYLDGKIDKERFKKSYNIEIRNLVENPNFSELYDKITTRYKATVKVYEEWNDSEK